MKIKRISKILRAICKVLLAVVTFVFLAAVVAIVVGRGTLSLFDDSAHVSLSPLTFPVRLVLAVIAALTMAVFLKGLYHLHRLFGNYGRGDIFTTDSAGQIRQLGITALLWFGAQFLWGFTVVALTQGPPPISFQFHSDCLVIGPVVIVISWFMEMAAETREENELTI
jgi:hypothetical protein